MVVVVVVPFSPEKGLEIKQVFILSFLNPHIWLDRGDALSLFYMLFSVVVTHIPKLQISWAVSYICVFLRSYPWRQPHGRWVSFIIAWKSNKVFPSGTTTSYHLRIPYKHNNVFSNKESITKNLMRNFLWDLVVFIDGNKASEWLTWWRQSIPKWSSNRFLKTFLCNNTGAEEGV